MQAFPKKYMGIWKNMQNDSPNAVYRAIGLAKKAGRLVEGGSKCIGSADAGKLKFVIIAKDAADDTRRKVTNACIRNGVECVVYGTGRMLGRMTGKTIRMALGVTDDNMVKLIVSKIKEEAGVSEWIRK